MDPTKVADLKAFVAACKKDPALLADPSLAFFRDYLASLGAELPQAASASKPAGPKVLILILIHLPFSAPDPPPLLVVDTIRFGWEQVSSMDDIDEEDVDGDDEEYDEPMRDPTPEPDELDEEILESDIELEADGVVEPDHDDTPQKVPPFALLCSSLVPRN
jgi:suppressor of tumorigenicity protein 13